MNNSKEILLKAQKEGYAVPAFNCHNLETIQVIVEMANEMRSPVIIAGTPGTFDYAGRDYIQAIVEVASKKYNIPLVLHGAFGISEEQVRKVISLEITKVNIATELKIFFSDNLRKCFVENSEVNDLRKYMNDTKKSMSEVVKVRY